MERRKEGKEGRKFTKALGIGEQDPFFLLFVVFLVVCLLVVVLVFCLLWYVFIFKYN